MIVALNTQMNNNQPLWKHIGKQEVVYSPESSVTSNRHRKGFQINFQDEIWSPPNSPDRLRTKRVDSIPQNYYLSEQSAHQRTPMILTTMDIDANKFEEEQALEVISLQSEKQKVVNLNYILGSFKQIQDKNKLEIRTPNVAQILAQTQAMEKKRISNLNPTIKELLLNVNLLKQHLFEYKMILNEKINQMSNFFVNSRTKIEQNLQNMANNKENEPKESKKQTNNETIYKKQIESLKEDLKREKEKCILYKEELQYELKKIKNSNQSKEQQKRRQLELQKVKVEQKYVSKIKNLQQELLDIKSQKDSIKLKTNKLKEEIMISNNNLQRTNEENALLRKNLKEMRDKLQDAQTMVRKNETKMTLEREKQQNENNHNLKQIGRLKQECSRLCSLLKQSQEQLKQCDELFASLAKKNKDLQEQTSKLNNKVRQIDMQYYKKLQVFDKMLLQIEGNLQKVNENHQKQKQQYFFQSQRLQKEKQKLAYIQAEMKSKQFEMQQMRKELQQQMLLLQKKEEGMKAEYRLAVQAQNATKDKWYQRYYNFFPEKEQKRYFMNPPTKDTNNFPITSRQSKNEVYAHPIRQNISPPKQLYRVKSQKNFVLNTGRESLKPKGKFFELQKPESYKDYNITNRIDSLRKQLTKQLNHMNGH